MKAASDDLKALLASRQFNAYDLYTFTLVDGTVLRYTTADIDITANGHSYSCGGQTGPFFNRSGDNSTIKWSRGLDVKTLEFDVIPKNATINGVSFLPACRKGVFDGATLQVERAFTPLGDYSNTAAGTVILFVGRVAELDLGRSMAHFQVASFTELLNIQMPRNLYQAGCVNTLFDASCALIKANFATSGTVASGSTVSQVNATLAQASGYFDLGVITFTSGANAGVSRTIKSYTNGSPGAIKLITPLSDAPATSDTFTIYPGCDKTQATCQNKFSNIQNFRGMPFVPAAETAV